MKKVLVVLCVWAIILGACSGTNKVTYTDGGLTKITDKGNITIVGLAINKAGLPAIKFHKKVYYIINDVSGVWPDDLIGKKVRVWGRFAVWDKTKLARSKHIHQRGPAVNYIMEEADFEVVE